MIDRLIIIECAVYFEGLEQLLDESEDDALRRQVRGVLETIGATNDRRASVHSQSQPRTAGKTFVNS